MEIHIETTPIKDVIVLQHEIFQDDRGFFLESFRRDKFEELGLPTEYVQDNHSGSVHGVLRGLHFQWDPPVGKLMRV
ncbi:MAG TPA: dTDP-4-dehydrorhamnose 3,5-epimerase family protein, partial [Acidobacteriota bacterium]|nr:dTDP-4-dehydrorhamnose 3,5-epimerase family protein [Acidobacteriota bacterium]